MEEGKEEEKMEERKRKKKRETRKGKRQKARKERREQEMKDVVKMDGATKNLILSEVMKMGEKMHVFSHLSIRLSYMYFNHNDHRDQLNSKRNSSKVGEIKIYLYKEKGMLD